MFTPSRIAWIIFLILFISNSPSFGQSTSYRARYTTNSARYFIPKEQIGTRDGGTIVIGKWGQVSEDSSFVMAMKLDQYGAVLWSKHIATGGLLGFFSVCELTDGSIAITVDLAYYVNPLYYSDILLLRLNCRGEVLWSNRVAMSTAVGKKVLQPMSVKEGKNSDLILSFYDEVSTLSVVCRFDNNGALVWSRSFRGPDPAPGAYTYYSAVAFYQDNSIKVFGFKNFYNNYIDLNKHIFGMRLNYDNGATEDERSYDYSEFNTNNYGYLGTSAKRDFNAELLPDGSFALFGVFTNFTPQEFYSYKLIINRDLSVKQSQAFEQPLFIGLYSAIYVLPDGQTHICSGNNDDQTSYWYSSDNSFNKIRELKAPLPGNILYAGNVVSQSGPSRSNYVLGGISRTDFQVFIDEIQVEDGNNKLSTCLGPDTSWVQLRNYSVSSGSWSWASEADKEVTASPLPAASIDFPVNKTYLCAPDEPSVPFKIVGPTVICSTDAAQLFQVHTPNNANKPVQWKIDQATYRSLTIINDSTVSILFKAPVDFPYKVELIAGGGSCLSVQDSIAINVDPAPVLPRYVTICGNSITLQPGNWFKSYRWQDGSTNADYTIHGPGQIIVELETYCGDKIIDTVDAYDDRVGSFGKPVVCERDTITLKAPGGLADYDWEPAYHLSAVNDSIVRIYPAKDTFYVFTATTLNGCHLKDTIPITVRKAQGLYLGPDVDLCQYDNLILDGGSGFQNWAWSTGESTQSITVVTPGLYSVKAEDNNGCRASDTIEIRAKVCLDQFSMPNAFSPNGNGINDVFKPHVQGRLTEYELVIYNRWGGMIFRTTNPASGWNGNYNGSLQSPGIYAWICRYKFTDATRKTEKGILMLVR